MKRLLPDSIGGRSMVVLLVGLTVSHMLSTAVYSTDHQTAAPDVTEAQVADRVAAVAGLLDQADAARRDRLVAALNSAVLSVRLAPEAAASGDHQDSPERDAVRAALAPKFGPLGHDRLHVVESDADSRGVLGHHTPDTRNLQVSLRLDDGGWANFGLSLARPVPFWSQRSVWSAVIMALGVAVFSAVATRWIGWPLATFASAADRLGRDVNAPPLPPGGPKEVRRAAAAFNEMQARIRRFVEDRTRMLAAISHDLRSPITRLRLRAEMLPEGEPRTRMLADLDEMQAMVASTLEFAKGEETDEPVQTVDLAATLEAVCDNASDLGLAAEYAWTGRLVCTCRPFALKRALANLVENGARYGTTAHVHAARHGHDVRVVIDDDGPGIPDDKMETVFTPFYRVEQSRSRRTGGIGLGLTVARTIIRAHGGDITLENKPQGGLRVTVSLPQDRDGA